MGVTCSASERGWASLNHNVALNLKERTCRGLKIHRIEIKDVPARFQYLCTLLVSSMGLPMSLPFRLNSGSKYSSAVMAVGL